METQSSNIELQPYQLESEIRAFFDHFCQAVRSENVDDIMSYYAPDVVAFDLMPPLQYKGAEAYRQAWKDIEQLEAPMNFDLKELTIYAEHDLSFAHSIASMSGKTKGGKDINMSYRYTVGLRRIRGDWKIVHENISVPIDMKSNAPLYNLQ